MKLYQLALCLLVLPTTLLAQPKPLASLAEARKMADNAVELFQQEKFAEGYESLKPWWPLPPVEIDSLANQTDQQWPMVKQRFGKSLGTEFIRESKAGNSFAQYVYIQKFQRHAVRWVFMFYKPENTWLINSVSFDDSVSLLFE
jgi:hypothetical protein